MINRDTRVTNMSSNCIDHTYLNNLDLYANRGCLDIGLSDHSLVFITRKKKKLDKTNKTIKIPNYRNFNIDLFNADVENADWDNVFLATNVDDAVDVFNVIFTKILDVHLPWKRIRVRCLSTPGVTNEFLRFIDACKYRSKIYNCCPCNHHLQIKKEAQQQVQHLKNSVKCEYIQNYLREILMTQRSFGKI